MVGPAWRVLIIVPMFAGGVCAVGNSLIAWVATASTTLRTEQAHLKPFICARAPPTRACRCNRSKRRYRSAPRVAVSVARTRREQWAEHRGSKTAGSVAAQGSALYWRAKGALVTPRWFVRRRQLRSLTCNRDDGKN